MAFVQNETILANLPRKYHNVRVEYIGLENLVGPNPWKYVISYSTIPGAGLGLFARVDLLPEYKPPNQRVGAERKYRFHRWTPEEKAPLVFASPTFYTKLEQSIVPCELNAFIIHHSEKLLQDEAGHRSLPSFANHADEHHRACNARLVSNYRAGQMRLAIQKPIRAGQEILWDYGPDYWQEPSTPEKTHPEPKLSTQPAA